jgi:hypothetical protein
VLVVQKLAAAAKATEAGAVVVLTRLDLVMHAVRTRLKLTDSVRKLTEAVN